MTPRRTLALVILAAAWTQLPGAGCRTHHAAPITADVTGGTGNVIVLYFPRENLSNCKLGAQCLDRPELWGRLSTDGQKKAKTVVARDGVVRVEGITSYIGVDYVIDIIAVEDRNGNGKLDVGERYGMWADGPLVRAREKKVGAIIIAIDKTLASPPASP